MLSRIAVPAALTAAVAISLVTGAPRDLPDVALSSTVLFHVERSVAVLAGFVAVLVLVIRAWSGQLPTELSTQGLKYGASDSTAAGALDHIALEWEAARAELADVLDRLDALEKRA
jgi:hypothetical protein